MTPAAPVRLLLLSVACLAGSGCSVIYAPNGLPGEAIADVEGFEGRWRVTDERGEGQSFDIVRSAKGTYEASFAPDGRSRSSVSARTYAVGGRNYAVVTVRGTRDGEDLLPLSFPVLVRLGAGDAPFTSVATLKGEFLDANPSVLPFKRLTDADGRPGGEYVVTATPRQLADFLTLVGGNDAAWEVYAKGEPLLSREPPAVGWEKGSGVPASSPPGSGSGGGRTLWGVLGGLFWYGCMGLLAMAAVGAVRNAYLWLRGQAISSSGPRQAWLDGVIRLLVLAARSNGGLPGERPRRLVASVAAAEAKRPDAPGEPLPLSPAAADALVRAYEDEDPGAADVVALLTLPGNAALRTRLLKRVWQILVCDGPASDAEVAFASGYAAETEVPEAEFVAVSRRYHRPGPPADLLIAARGLLEVPASVTAEEVKKAYKRKAREYHPDSHAGVAENLKRLAAERFSQLGEARDLLLAVLDGGRLVARAPGGGFVPAADLPSQVRCFGCDAVRPGVPPDRAAEARCPGCLALLYQDPDVARELTRGQARESAG